ncbi:DUF5615 family PIN-like protein [candidate division KSB1 bacterium]|nr:DUF5615 family PIN-like protein [candidate division KSB1 bacterium]
MILLADENIDKEIVDGLRFAGYDVLYVAEMEPGITDEKVMNFVNKLSELLMTLIRILGNWFFGAD